MDDKQAAILSAMTDAAKGAPPPGGQAPAPKPEAKDTDQDKATAKGSPETEGDKSKSQAVVYDVNIGGESRKLTPEQIAGTYDRYGQLNFKQAQMKPVIDLVDQFSKQTGITDPRQIAGAMQSLLARANQKNPQMGDDGQDANRKAEPKGTKTGQNNQDISAALTQWENDNAATLPPGYKEMIMGGGPGMQQMQAQMQQMQQMMRMIMAQAQGATGAARDGMQQAQNQQVQAMRQQIGNNLDRVQQALQIPDDKANDFMVFAAERGYTLEDFADPQLTIKVMQDYKNNMNSPEMERMRAMAERRQSWTGSMGGTPAGGGAPAKAAPAEGGSTFDQMADKVVARRQAG